MAIFSPDARSNLRSCISFMCQISLVSFKLEQFLTKPFFFFFNFHDLYISEEIFYKTPPSRFVLSFLRVTLKLYTLGIKKRALLCPSGCCVSESDHLLEVDPPDFSTVMLPYFFVIINYLWEDTLKLLTSCSFSNFPLLIFHESVTIIMMAKW